MTHHIVEAVAFLGFQCAGGLGHHLGVALQESIPVALECPQALSAPFKDGELPPGGLSRAPSSLKTI